MICPVCSSELKKTEKYFFCPNGHSFDIAKEGYVNLLRKGKSGDLIGDDKESCRSRRDFLSKGYYSVLKNTLCDIFSDKEGSLLDICCGEGYYTSALGGNKKLDVYGFDISKEMVRLAAKRGNATYFVANMTSIPFRDGSFDYAVHLFAPYCEKEFARILKPGGILYSVIPGKRHLFGLKELLYSEPYENDEAFPVFEKLELSGTQKVRNVITLENSEDINAVFRMTPYFFHTSESDKKKLDGVEKLTTEIEFVIGQFTRK